MRFPPSVPIPTSPSKLSRWPRSAARSWPRGIWAFDGLAIRSSTSRTDVRKLSSGRGMVRTATVAVFDVAGPTPTRVTEFFPFATSNPDFLGGVSLDVAPIDEDRDSGRDRGDGRERDVHGSRCGPGIRPTPACPCWERFPRRLRARAATRRFPWQPRIPTAADSPMRFLRSRAPSARPGKSIALTFSVDLAADPPFSYQPALPLGRFHGPLVHRDQQNGDFCFVLGTSGADRPSARERLDQPRQSVGRQRRRTSSRLWTCWKPSTTSTFARARPRCRPSSFHPRDSSTPTPTVRSRQRTCWLSSTISTLAPASSGEGETSEPRGETDVIFGFPEAALGRPCLRDSAEADRPRDRGFAVFDLPGLPDAPWPPSAPDEASRLAPGFVEPRLDEIDVLALDAVLEEIAAEIAGLQTSRLRR